VKALKGVLPKNTSVPQSILTLYFLPSQSHFECLYFFFVDLRFQHSPEPSGGLSGLVATINMKMAIENGIQPAALVSCITW
jgi:hypothetical protein